jgi:hypothetical protein
MKAIPSAISEKGGFTAQFIGDGYSVDARKEILPNTIKENGVQVGEGVAWNLIQSFLKNCAAHAAATGETVTVGSLISFGLAIRGWFANKDSKASKENVRVTATLLNDLRPTVVFSMSNDIEGFTLLLTTVMSDGCALGHVKQAAKFRINGKYLQLLEGDKVTASAKNAAGDTVEAECAVIESAEDHIDATLPAAFDGDEFVGREITFKVEGRCGDPEAGTQTKSIEAILDKGADGPKITRVVCEGHEDTPDTLFDGGAVKIEGTGLAGATMCTFTCQDMSGSEHQGDFVRTDPDFTASNTLVTIDVISIVENMREKCGQAGSSLDLTVGATITLTLADGSTLSHNVAIGE